MEYRTQATRNADAVVPRALGQPADFTTIFSRRDSEERGGQRKPRAPEKARRYGFFHDRRGSFVGTDFALDSFACNGSGVRVSPSPPLKSRGKPHAAGVSSENSGEGRGSLASSFFIFLRPKWGETWGERPRRQARSRGGPPDCRRAVGSAFTNCPSSDFPSCT